ncbi:MAG: hypothetical protein HDS59_09300 [Barnesiella sp.]|nr:hypothetical protein [Barnesiella sp.]
MKLLKWTLCVVICLLFVQCDTAERRKNRAEEAIEKQLFESLNNYQSYEKISTEIDTLKEVWMTSEEILSKVQKFMALKAEGMEIEEQIQKVNATVERNKKALFNSFFFGKGDFMSMAIDADEDNKKLEHLTKLEKENLSVCTALLHEMSELYGAMDIPKEPYWHIKHKFRYSETNGNETRIYVLHYIFDPSAEKIIFSWDDDDRETQDAIQQIDSFVDGPDNEIDE